jgi:hypothetical protein
MARGWDGGGVADIGEEGFGGGVAVEDVVFAAFLVIDDELDRDAGIAGPVGKGRGGAVPD